MCQIYYKQFMTLVSFDYFFCSYYSITLLQEYYTHYVISYQIIIIIIHPSNGVTAQIGPWPPLLRFHNNNVLRCEVVSLTTNPR
jgi:hypothetical protein